MGMNFFSTNFLPPIGADRDADAIRGMHSRCIVIRSKDPKAEEDAKKMRRKKRAMSRRKKEDDVRKKGERERNEARRERMKRYPTLEEGISGHYFLQYFNVKSFGFLEPSYRFL